jgi:hypothetical protein
VHGDRLARTGALVAIAVCLTTVTLTVGLLARDWYISSPDQDDGVSAATYRSGEQIDLSPDAFDAKPYTLLVFARQGCAACDQSKPLLTTFIREALALPNTGVALITSSDYRRQGVQLAEELGLSSAEVVPVDTARIKIQRLPALAWVDRHGEILKFHEGVLTEADRGWVADMAPRLSEH